jgi:hypothetical protein
MGMYDEITCEYPLPSTGYGVPTGHEFQTQDFENLLDRYSITADGTLLLHEEEWEEVPEPERPYYGSPHWDKPLGRWIGSLRAVPLGEEEVLYDGDVRFYDAFRLVGGGRVWIEYRASFVWGRLNRIEVEEIRDLPPPKRTETIGGWEYPVHGSDLGIDIMMIKEEVGIERDDAAAEG